MPTLDIQINGYAGVDFCSSDLCAGQLQQACKSLAKDFTSSCLATLITDQVDQLIKKLSQLICLRSQDHLVKETITGFHIEGPFLNPLPGFIGAHPAECVVPANVDDAKRLLDAGEGLVRLVTLAPEHDEGFRTTKFLADQGVTVSAGHCNPTLDQLQGAIDNGLTMITHFGNGCPVELPRHDNFLQRVLHLRRQLWICFIPDGVHIDFFALKNYLDLVGTERAIMVTDAISAATLGPGTYEISGLEVEVDEHGTARRPCSANLAGSTITMPKIRDNLKHKLGFDDEAIKQMIDINPRRALEQSPP